MFNLIAFRLSLILILVGVRRSFSIEEDHKSLEECLKAPDTVLIECKIYSLNNSLKWTCVEPNVISLLLANKGKNANGDKSVLVNCTAPYPIDIFISGFQLRDSYKTLFIRNAENVFNEATFVYSIGLYVENFTLPRRVTVSKYSDPSNQMSFFMFQPGSERVLFPTETNPMSIEKTPGKTTIPCISSDPYKIPNLITQETNSKISENSSGIHYDRTKGFVIGTNSSVKPEGFYKCFDGRFTNAQTEEELPTVFEVVPRKELWIEPNMKEIILFINHELHLKCRYKRKIQLVGKFRGESIHSQTTVDGSEFTSTFSIKKVKVGDKGNIDCVDEETSTVLHSWTVETLDIYKNSVLQLQKLDNNQVACLSPFEDVTIETVFCQGVSNCNLNTDCFTQGSTCSNLRQGHRCTNASGSCLHFTSEDFFTQGMIRCKTQNYTYTTKYFRGFDGILYLNWESAPLNALIEVRVPTNITMFPHNSYPFGCRASRFISDGKIQWVIRGKDGSEILLHKKRVQDIKPTYDNLNYDLYTVRESNIRLIYPNDYDILCMVPMWNATASLRNHKRINVADKKAPVKEIVIAACAVIILLIIPLVYVMWRLKKTKDAIRNLTDQEVEEFLNGNPDALQEAGDKKDAHEVVDAIPYNQDLEIPRNKLLIDTENILGQGAFGTILKGKVEGIPDVVAVKTVKPRCEVEQFKGFLSELKIMMHIGKHPFVVGLIGAYTDKIREKVIFIVVEYCTHGSLEHFLRTWQGSFVDQIKEDAIDPKIIDEKVYTNLVDCCLEMQENNKFLLKTVDLIRWAYEIATGMAHLASKKVVHADLACRNVLIHESGTAKITDFGLSRQLFEYTQYVKKHQEPLPWRWMAIESLRSLTFSTQSDVWSYGVTLWEIFSLGDVPYPGLAWTISFVEELSNGLRMVKPPHATSAIYNLMVNCWEEKAHVRPTFQLLSEYFYDLMVSLNVNPKAPFEAMKSINQNNTNPIRGTITTTGYGSTGNENIYQN